MRSYIAEKMACLVPDLQLSDETRNQYLKEAFYSKTDVTNYLRILHETNDYMDINDILKHIEISKDSYFNYKKEDELTENMISQNTYFTLKFFNGEFNDVFDNNMNGQQISDCDYTLMTSKIILFCLLLNKNESLGCGCSYICDYIISKSHFDVDCYQKAINRIYFYDNKGLFMSCFNHWKEFIHLSKQQEEKYLNKIEIYISQSAEYIMKSKYRDDYNQCAAIIAAFGEVKESRGFINGKQLVMNEYGKKYHHVSALVKELKLFGMND